MATLPLSLTPQTQEQWYQKIRSFIPEWYFEEEDNQEAHIQGLAKMFSVMEQDIIDHVMATYIEYAEASTLEEHGDERSVVRSQGELDAQYRERIRNIKNESNCPDIQALVDKFLIIGTSTIIEDFNNSLFASRGAYANRGYIVLEPVINVFSILVDKQLHEPYSFASREYFASRGDFAGTSESSEYVFGRIQEAINTNKALGTLYRVIEKIGA